MNIETKTDLIPTTLPLPALFHDAAGMAKVLDMIEKRALSETADVETEEGRASIKSLAHKVARSKTALDGVGKPLADAARNEYDKINALRKIAKDTLDALKSNVRKPLTDWEDVEKQRIAALDDRLTAIVALREYDRTVNPEVIASAITSLEALATDAEWQEFEGRASEESLASLEHLKRVLAEAREDEAKEAELEALRAEKLEREAADAEREREARIKEREKIAADNARRQAEINAEAALEREKDRNQREFDRAQREVAGANQRAAEAAQAERERAEKFEAEKYAARERREKDDIHRAKVFDRAIQGLVDYPVKLKPHDAAKVVGAISDKLVPHLIINF